MKTKARRQPGTLSNVRELLRHRIWAEWIPVGIGKDQPVLFPGCTGMLALLPLALPALLEHHSNWAGQMLGALVFGVRISVAPHAIIPLAVWLIKLVSLHSTGDVQLLCLGIDIRPEQT